MIMLKRRIWSLVRHNRCRCKLACLVPATAATLTLCVRRSLAGLVPGSEAAANIFTQERDRPALVEDIRALVAKEQEVLEAKYAARLAEVCVQR